MAYTAQQYAAQDRIMEQIRWSSASGLCPVCHAASCGHWPDGAARITCGDQHCFERWLNIRPAHPHQTQPGAGTLPVTIVLEEST